MKNHTLKRIAAGLTAAIVLLGCAACSSPAGNASSSSAAHERTDGLQIGKKSFTYALSTQPDHLDPYLATTADSRLILFNIFEGLVKPDRNGYMQPALAESSSVSSDGTTYTFVLRKGVKFQNGKPVTADDVKYSLETAAGLSGGKQLVAGLSDLKSVETAGGTVKLHLKKADYDFMPNLSVSIVPKGYTQQDSHPIGTGPYSFVSATPQKIELKKNPDYWQKKLPYLDTVSFQLESSTDAILADLKHDTIDGASLPNNAAPKFNDQKYKVTATNSNAVQMLALNNKMAPFNKPDVRKALNYAVDTAEIIRTVDFGRCIRCATPVIPGLKSAFNSTLSREYPHNAAKAKQMLAKAGYPNGFSMTILVPTNYPVHVQTANTIADELKQVGITVLVKQVDFATWRTEVCEKRNYQAAVISVDGATASAGSYLDRYVSGAPGNFVNFSNAAYDKLMAQIPAEKDSYKRNELYRQAQKLLTTDAASVYIGDLTSINILRNGYSGFTSYPLYVLDASVLQNVV